MPATASHGTPDTITVLPPCSFAVAASSGGVVPISQATEKTMNDSIPHATTPSISELQEQVRKLTEELSALKVKLYNESKRADREVIENGVLDSIIDKLIDKMAD